MAVNATKRPECGFDVFPLSVGQPSMMETNARCKAVGQLLSKIGLAPPRQGLRQGLELLEAFRILLQKPFLDPFCKVLGFGLSAPSSADEHQHLRTLIQSIVDHAPNRVAFEAHQISRWAEDVFFGVLGGGLHLSWFNVKIMKRGVLKRYRPPVGLNQLGLKPGSEIRRIAHRCRKSDDLCIGFDVAKPGEIDLEGRSSGSIVHQVEFIGNHAAHVGHEFRAMAEQGIKLFRGAHQNVAVVDVFCLGGCVADAQPDRPAHAGGDLGQVFVLLHGQRLQRNDVDGFGAFMAF